MERGRIERNFPIAAGDTPQIVVRNPSGLVEVRGEARDDVAVVVTCDPPDAFARGVEVVAEQRGARVIVEAKWPGAHGWLRGANVRVTIEVRTPTRSEVQAEVASSDLEIAAIAGAVSVRGASGDVRLVDLTGPLTVQTASGDVRAHNVRGGRVKFQTASGELTIERGTGDLEVHGTSGDIFLKEVIGTLTARTVSGDVHIPSGALTSCRIQTVSGDLGITTAIAPRGAYEFTTVSGDLILHIPQETGATIFYQTISGDVSSELPSARQGGKRNGTLTINGGGTEMRVKTVSGDFHVRAASDTLPPMPEAQPTPALLSAPTLRDDAPRLGDVQSLGDALPEPPSATLDILQAVERGELSIDEAMAQLASLERDEG